jgi:hypothetical protein
MLKNLNAGRKTRAIVVAALLCGGAVSIPAVAQSGGNSAAVTAVSTSVSLAPDVAPAEANQVTTAALSFIRGMAAKDADAVWMFASEEDQDAFATEQAVYSAFAETFPVLTQVDEVMVESVRQEGDTPFLELFLTDANGEVYKASLGLWQDDAGDWKVISLAIAPATDRLA